MRRRSKTERRFKVGDRVAWVSPSAKLGLDARTKKTGTVVSVGATRAEALAGLDSGYKTAYNSGRNARGPFYYVAADTPLFKPGFTAHSVPERRLQKESDTLDYKLAAIRALEPTTLGIVAALVATSLHKNPKKQDELTKDLNKLCPEAFPLAEKGR
jgi:hypothetical protein